MKNEEYHEPVLLNEVLEELEILAPLKKKVQIIDATLGTGGHAIKMIEKGVWVLGIEADPEILKIAKSRLVKYAGPQVHGNFVNIDKVAKENGFNNVDAILFDLGVSNLQLTDPNRGFSFSNPEAALDMRVDPKTQGVTGADLLNVLRMDQLRGMFSKVLDAGSSKWLSQRVLDRRLISPIKTVGDLIEISRGLKVKERLNPATLPFLAVRIAVNSELENLQEALIKSFEIIKKGGKILVITFHSKEEEVVLDYFKNLEREKKGRVVGPIKPSREEILRNPRSRSAELFTLTKII